MKKYTVLIVVSLILIALDCNADNYPFPQNTVYPFGLMPVGRNYKDADTSYAAWKNSYVTQNGAGGFRRILSDVWNPQCPSPATVSEGIGYGMLLAANHDDKALFDDLWNYYKLHLDANGLMHWCIDANGNVSKQNAATDADEDVAFALILADRQWGSSTGINYLQDAISMINKILQHEVEATSYVLKPGDVWGGSAITNLSYFSPAYYRIFKMITGNAGWDKVIMKGYEILQKAAHPVTGLVPDWSDQDGRCVPNWSCDYKYDAVRTLWRIALDHVWFGIPQAHDFAVKITNFVEEIGIKNVKDGYRLNGTVIGLYHNSSFVGTFATGCMAADPINREFCNDAYIENVAVPGDSYYNMSLRTLTLFLQTGNFFNPASANLIILSQGFNLFSYPGSVLPAYSTCLALLAELGSADEIAEMQRFDPGAQRFEACDNQEGHDFPVVAGEGYEIRMKTAKSVLLPGQAVCPSLILKVGLSLVGHPAPPSNFSCYKFLSLLGSEKVGSIQHFNRRSSAFESCAFYAGNGVELQPMGEDFPILAGEGYLVHSKANSTVVLPGCGN